MCGKSLCAVLGACISMVIYQQESTIDKLNLAAVDLSNIVESESNIRVVKKVSKVLIFALYFV